ncbi:MULTISPECIES: SigE family RNA polymerase sigma factor [unclassified Streptomyces]|uniref:SigE family RNA polymerase sigma factor n=1 Tax=unclassified Streptomyces TaxID=2593676 RepID=UPI00168B689E|nr:MULTISPECIES: SigE family RNA polymerase sigma factor [unclassified Streptomyces]MBD3010365.1 SigE family RNA polymerase sigma factor [Streptomyces sp. 5-10]
MRREEEFDDFYALAYPRLVRQLYAMTGDLSEAQDVVQEAFIKAWDRWERFSGAASQEAWIRTTAWRLAVSRFRRVRRGLQLLQRHHEDRHVEGPSPEHIALMDALKTLPAKQRSVIVLYHLCDLSVEQISAEMGWPTGSVRTWLVRGRTSLAHYLSPLPDKEVDHVG